MIETTFSAKISAERSAKTGAREKTGAGANDSEETSAKGNLRADSLILELTLVMIMKIGDAASRLSIMLIKRRV